VPCFDCPWPTFAFWIADNGLVAGQSTVNAIDPLTSAPVSLAVLWKDGAIVNLGTLGGFESAAAAVNRRGDVVGAALNATTDPFASRARYTTFFIYGYGTEPRAFLWRNGTMQDLGTLGGPDSKSNFGDSSFRKNAKEAAGDMSKIGELTCCPQNARSQWRFPSQASCDFLCSVCNETAFQ